MSMKNFLLEKPKNHDAIDVRNAGSLKTDSNGVAIDIINFDTFTASLLTWKNIRTFLSNNREAEKQRSRRVMFDT